ncbi:tetratricopeptide repeat protein [Methylocapsa acidiphila]|uniref:tetratricopeptide repeat protein n=1 Tax=Methylocapsa acidiphila TaxID=133552 RepID=UPI00047B04F1|nr:tetratricopeptide repeat protein [Methylocapsa acidiphila]
MGARAQTAPGPIGEPALFQDMLRRPTDLDATLRFAASAAQAGDVEASIGALERILFFNPNLSSVRFELGMLYFRLGSYEMARGYFQAAQAASDASPAMRQRAQDFLDTIDKKLQPDQISGFAQTGFRYQSNASLGPNQQSLIGATRPVNSQFFGRPDWNWFGIFGVNYVHDFGNQNGDVLEANLLGYDSQQFNATAVDARFLDLRVGPRFGILQDALRGASVKPYVVGTGMMLGDAPYLASGGGGVTMHLNWGEAGFDPFVEVRQSGYHSSNLYPLAYGLDGTLTSVGLPAAGPIVEGVQWRARFVYNHSDDAFAWYSFDRYAFDIAFPIAEPSPWGGRAWTLTPSFGVGRWLYRQPDPTTNPFITEHDLEWRAGLGLDIPIKDRFGLGLQVQYRTLNSNILGNSVRDFSITMGPTVAF